MRSRLDEKGWAGLDRMQRCLAAGMNGPQDAELLFDQFRALRAVRGEEWLLALPRNHRHPSMESDEDTNA